ncbi:MAG: FAD-dependent monooxygenase [Bacteroidota bacterium]
MNVKEHVPVIVIGGGPAGIAAALTLNARNIPCIVVDAKTGRYHHYGECLPPNALPLFKQLGLQQLLDNEEHTYYLGNQSVWGNNKVAEKLFLFQKHNQGVLLNRPLFEEQLRDLLLKSKSRLLTGYAFHNVVSQGEKLNVTLKSKTETLPISCNFIIDATGRKASVCRKLGRQKEQLDQLAALHFQVTLNTTIPKFVYTESIENGWFYAAPLSKRKLSVMLFTDMDLLPEKDKQQAFICDAVNGSTLIKQLFSKPLTSDKITKLKTHAANSTRMQKPYGENWIAIGDAAYSFDPISSYGITSALAAGYYGAHALADTLAQKPDALQTYQYIMENAFVHYHIKLHEHYNAEQRWPDSLFWQRRHQE